MRDPDQFSFRHDIGGGFAADGLASKEAPGSPVHVELNVLSAIPDADGNTSTCWVEFQGRINDHNSTHLIQIGMPVVPDL